MFYHRAVKTRMDRYYLVAAAAIPVAVYYYTKPAEAPNPRDPDKTPRRNPKTSPSTGVCPAGAKETWGVIAPRAPPEHGEVVIPFCDGKPASKCIANGALNCKEPACHRLGDPPFQKSMCASAKPAPHDPEPRQQLTPCPTWQNLKGVRQWWPLSVWAHDKGVDYHPKNPNLVVPSCGLSGNQAALDPIYDQHEPAAGRPDRACYRFENDWFNAKNPACYKSGVVPK